MNMHKIALNLKQINKSCKNQPIVTRFAPSPTGFLHLGHIASALFVWGIGRLLNAKILLRIEDHDQGRSRPEYVEGIFDDLDWLGLEYQVERRKFVASEYVQSNCFLRYNQKLQELKLAARTFACQCSRKAIHAASPVKPGQEARYPGTCEDLQLAEGEGRALRLRLEARHIQFDDLWLGPQSQDPRQQIHSLVLKDRVGQWSYHFSSVVDDIIQGVNLIIRGQDILSSTSRQIYLQQLLGVTSPPSYLHHPLIMQSEDKKLSKSLNSTSIQKMRANGLTPEQVLGKAAFQVGLTSQNRELANQDLASLFR